MANIPVDPTKSAVQNLLDLVDASNPAAPSKDTQVTTSHLTAVAAGSISADPTADTTVEIDAVAGQGYSGSVMVNYTRLSLNSQINAETGAAALTSSMTADQMLQAVATHFNLIVSEISWQAAPSVGDPQGIIQTNNSLVYEDEAVAVDLSWS